MITGKQEKFIESYCKSGNATQAALDAGYSEKPARQQGHQLKKTVKSQIDTYVVDNMSDVIPENLSIVQELARNSPSDSVKLSAANSLLDRAGLKPIERIETTNTDSLSVDEIKKEIDALNRLTFN